MISERDVDRILRAPFRHVAADAVFAFAVRGMAAETGLARDGLRRVRIVAGGAQQFAAAFSETGGLEKPVSGAVYFETIVLLAIELQNVGIQRFAGPIGKRVSAEPPQGVEKLGARSLQMALETDVHLQLRG